MKSNPAFGQWLQSKREERQLSLLDLAKKIGTSKPQKWVRKIQTWEQGDALPKDRLRKKICVAFGIPVSEWTKAYRTLVSRPVLDRRPFDQDIPAQNRSLVARNFHLLQRNMSRIQQTQQWRDIHLHDFRMGLMYIGGNAMMRLGPLLQFWSNGRLVSRKDGRLFYALHGGGSPLTSFQVFYGFYAGCGIIHKKNSLFYPLAQEVMPIVRHLNRAEIGVSGWSLPQLLAQLGAEIPKANIQKEGKDWAHYCFQTSTLTIGERRVVFPLSEREGHRFHTTERSISEEYGPAEVDGVLVLANIQTMQFGEWKGENWSLKDEQGQFWTLLSNGLRSPNEQMLLQWNIDIPPLVGEWLFTEVRSQNRIQ